MTTVTVYSAAELDSKSKKAIGAYLSKAFGTDSAKYSVDKSLIAGIKIKSSDKQVELTLSDLLDNMGKSLT